jgi:hypothetical protein
MTVTNTRNFKERFRLKRQLYGFDHSAPGCHSQAIPRFEQFCFCFLRGNRISSTSQPRNKTTMGCGASNTKHVISHVDDSVKVMLKHDERRAKSKGEAHVAYKPRAEHPLLKPKTDQGEGAGAAAPVLESSGP